MVNIRKTGGRPRKPLVPRDYSLRMDNLSDVPRPPTREEEEAYERWLEHRRNPQRTTINTKRYTYQSGPLRPRSYHLSYEAMEGLRKLARRHHYGHDLGAKQSSFSAFIRSLGHPSIQWLDTRPDYLKELDPTRIQLGRLPLWLLRDEQQGRMARTVIMSDNAELTLAGIAMAHAVTLKNNPTLASLSKPGTWVAALLELTGLGRLTPTNIPDNPHQSTKKYYRRFRNTFNEHDI